MDTVVGLQEESDFFLTLLWRKSKFMLIFKLESQTTEEVSKIFRMLREIIPYNEYKKLFQAILTDNGHEFLEHTKIEETLNTYTHLYKNALTDITSLIDDMNEARINS